LPKDFQVFLEQARQIKCPGGQTLDPIFEVEVLSEKKFTQTKDNIAGAGTTKWNEHIFFEKNNLVRILVLIGQGQQEVEGAKIAIKLLDKGYFKDALVGQYDFDISFVYFMNKEHALQHQWIAMQNPASPNFNEVTAYVKLSIAVSTTGDQ